MAGPLPVFTVDGYGEVRRVNGTLRVVGCRLDSEGKCVPLAEIIWTEAAARDIFRKLAEALAEPEETPADQELRAKAANL